MRTVILVLVDGDGRLLGALPEYPVSSQWWSEAGSVVTEARARFDVDAQVLRVLNVEPRNGGADHRVTYLAEVAKAPATGLDPVDVDLADHPLRAPYARVGGPIATLRWATAELRDAGFASPSRVVQGVRGTFPRSGSWPVATRQCG